jgi:hypothetical protein
MYPSSASYGRQCTEPAHQLRPERVCTRWRERHRLEEWLVVLSSSIAAQRGGAAAREQDRVDRRLASPVSAVQRGTNLAVMQSIRQISPRSAGTVPGLHLVELRTFQSRRIAQYSVSLR